MFENVTKNQHFVSQAEQRLNALNPDAPDRRKRIYSFKIADRESYRLALENLSGNLIENNLAGLDLFSFDVPGGDDLRHNFEAIFENYERCITTHTRNLLDKLSANNNDIKTEIIELFAAKFLNFVRNPSSVVKVLNTFPGLAAHDPTNPALLAMYRRVKDGKKPHQAHQCTKLGISDLQYLEWLRVLFMLLMPLEEGQPNFFDQIIQKMFGDRDNYLAVWVCAYDNDGCLLSDRGYSQPIADGPHTAFSFNLSKNAFINYIFADPVTLLHGKISPPFLDKLLGDRKQFPEKPVDVQYIRNDLNLLAAYNGHVVYQCHERVFCSIKEGVVLPS